MLSRVGVNVLSNNFINLLAKFSFSAISTFYPLPTRADSIKYCLSRLEILSPTPTVCNLFTLLFFFINFLN